MNKGSSFIILVFAALIFVAFFLPWVRVESAAVGQVSKLLTGKKQAAIDNISAFRVPIIANGPDARLMISVIKIFSPGITDADKKSYLIWLIPILAVVIFLVIYLFGKNKWVNLIFGLVGTLVFAVAAYKIKTTDLNKLIINITMGPGLWLTLWGYLGIGLAGLINFAKLSFTRKK